MKGKNVYWEVKTPFIASRVLGVAPITELFTLSHASLAYTIVIFLINTSVATHLGLMMDDDSQLYDDSGFTLILERFQLIIVFLSVGVAHIKSILNVKTISGVMSNIASLDKKLYDIGVLVPYSQFYGIFLTSTRMLLIFTLFIPELMMFNGFSRFDQTLQVQYCFIMPLLVVNIVQVQFIVLLELVQRRIKILIEKLKEIGTKSQFVKTQQLHTLVSVHKSLLTICDVVNWLYSPQILLILSSIFIVTTANLYHVIEKLILYLSKRKASDLNFILITTYKVFVRSLEVWTLVTTCVNTQDLANDFNNYLYQVMIDDKTSNNDLSNNKKLRLHISMKKEIVFTAWNFFTLDYTLVHSMIAAATTYLVILIQFGQPTSAPDNPASVISAAPTTANSTSV